MYLFNQLTLVVRNDLIKSHKIQICIECSFQKAIQETNSSLRITSFDSIRNSLSLLA